MRRRVRARMESQGGRCEDLKEVDESEAKREDEKKERKGSQKEMRRRMLGRR